MMESFSHEIKTPLNGAIGILEQIVTESLSKQNFSNELNYTYRCLQILHNNVNDVIDFNYIITKQFQLQSRKQNFHQFLTDFTAIAHDVTKVKGLLLISKLDSALPLYFTTDYARLKQICLNLLNNAIKFTVKGTITFTVSPLQSGFIQFSVIDTGNGINLQKQKKLKKLLTQQIGDFTSQLTFNKTGICLGLTISQMLSKMLGPRSNQNIDAGIIFSSIPGQGSMFSFIIEEIENEDNYKPFDLNPEIYISQDLSNYDSKFQIQQQQQSFSSKPIERVFKLESKFSIQQSCKSDEIMSQSEIKSFQINESECSDSKTIYNDQQQINVVPKFSNFRKTFIKNNSFEPQKKIKKYSDELIIASQNLFQSKIEQKTSKILLVDDDAFNLHTLKFLLSRRYPHIQCECALNGIQALEILENCDYQFQLILMDYQMPIMNGVEATKEIRFRESTYNKQAINIIACSAFESDEDISMCLQSGMNAFVKKPVTVTIIDDIIKKWM